MCGKIGSKNKNTNWQFFFVADWIGFFSFKSVYRFAAAGSSSVVVGCLETGAVGSSFVAAAYSKYKHRSLNL